MAKELEEDAEKKPTSRLQYALAGTAATVAGGGIGVGILALALPFSMTAGTGAAVAAVLGAGAGIINIASPLFNYGVDSITNAVRGGPHVPSEKEIELSKVFNAKSGWDDIRCGILAILESPFQIAMGAGMTILGIGMGIASKGEGGGGVVIGGARLTFLSAVGVADGAKDIVKGIQEISKSGKGIAKPEDWNASWTEGFVDVLRP